MQRTTLSRRGVMALFSWTSTAALLGCGTEKPDGQGQRVLILGAGVAGLTAAHELKKAGYEVTLLEGRERIGGRVWSVREGFEDGMFAEIGAVRIASTHQKVLAYADELGLEMQEFPSGDPLFYVKGQRFMKREGEPWPLDGLAETEKTAGLYDLWGTYVQSRFDEFGDPSQGMFAADLVDQYDPITWAEYLREQGASEAYVSLFAADNGSEVYAIGALAWMMAEVIDREWNQTYHIKGGNDMLPKRLAEAVGMDNIHLGHKVVRIEHGTTSVTAVATDAAGKEVRFDADFLVCTLPFPLLRDVEITPAFPKDKMDTIDGLQLMNAGRGYVQTRTRFWKEEGIGGLKIAVTDTSVERLWDLSEVQNPGSEKGMFVSYTMYKNADAYCGQSQDQRESYTLDHIEKFFPQIKDEKLAFYHHCWKDDPWAKGAWTDYLPGQWWMFAVARRPEGRVFFAGEHTSAWAGWMEGAIDSGQRAADEVMGIA